MNENKDVKQKICDIKELLIGLKNLEQRLNKFELEKGNIIDDEELELVKDEISTVTTKIQ